MTEFFLANKLAAAGIVIVGVLAVAAVLSPWLAPYDAGRQELENRLSGPSWQHPFGNDDLGRDILSRILLGARVSMRVGATVVLLSVFVGVVVGGFAAYVGGKIDAFVTAIVINFAMTALFLVVLLASRGLTGTDHVDGQEPEQ